MGEEKRNPQNGKERNEVRMIAENVVAVQTARQILDSGPIEEMGGEEKTEFERMKKIVNFAADLFENPDLAGNNSELGAAAASWNAFLHLFMRSILDESLNIKKRIENVFNEMIEEMESDSE